MVLCRQGRLGKPVQATGLVSPRAADFPYPGLGPLCVAQGEKQTLSSYLLFPAELDGSSPGLWMGKPSPCPQWVGFKLRPDRKDGNKQ